MYYILYGNKNGTYRRELTAKRQECATVDFERLEDFSYAMFGEDLINEKELLTFVHVMTEDDVLVFSVEGNYPNPKVYKNETHLNTLY